MRGLSFSPTHSIPPGMSLLGYKIVEDGYFLPRGLVADFDLVYDSHGRLIRESLLRRWGGYRPQGVILRGPSLLPSQFVRGRTRTVAESLVFLGPYDFQHYGHWITEGLARFWYLLRHRGEDVEAAAAPGTIPPGRHRSSTGPFRAWRSAFDAFRLARRVLPGAARAERIIVPDCSMQNRGYVHSEHLDTTRKIARDVLGDEHVAACGVPVYLSRTKLASAPETGRAPRRFDGELEIEQYCAARGCRVVHPETLSLRDQVRLFNAHDVFIGIRGSAFHTALFRIRRKRAVHLYLCSAKPTRSSKNYDLLDALTGTASYRIICATPMHVRHFALDARKAIGGIAAHLSTL